MRKLHPTIVAVTLALCGSAAAQTGRNLDSPAQRDHSRRSPSSILSSLANDSDTVIWTLPDSGMVTTRIDVKARGKAVRTVLDEMTKKLGMKWLEDGRLVLIYAQATDDPLRGKLGDKVVDGRTLKAWRVELATSRRRPHAAARALRKGGEPGLRVLIQAARNGPSWARWTAADEVKLAGKPAAKILLEKLEVVGPRERYSVEGMLRKIPAVGEILVKRLTKGTLAQRQGTLKMLLTLRTLPPGYAKGVLALIDDPQLGPRESRQLARDVARALRYASRSGLIEAATVWKKLLNHGDPSVRREAGYGAYDLVSRITQPGARVDAKARDAVLDDMTKILVPNLDDPSTAPEAARTLGAIARVRDKVLKTLETRLQNEADLRTRYALVDGIGYSRNPKAVPVLLRVLQSEPQLARQAGSALSRMGKAAAPALIQALKDKSPAVRRAACAALGGIARPPRMSTDKDERVDLVKHLAPLIQDADGEVRRTALSSIARCGKPGHATLLAALEHKDAAVRLAAVQAVSSAGREVRKKALPRLLKCLESDDPEVKIAAALAVRRVGKEAKGAGPALVAMLADPNERVQAAAATALSQIPCDAKKAVPLLVPLLGSRDSNARYNAMNTLRALGPEKAVLGIDAMVRLATSPETTERRAGLQALTLVAPVKNEKALAAVIEAAQSMDETFRGLAAKALVALAPGSQQAQDMLFVLVEDEKTSVRRSACEAYAKLKTIPKEHREALYASAQEMIAGRDYAMRRGGVTLMGRLAAEDPRALKALGEMLDGQGRSSSGRYEAERVLAELGAKALPLLLKMLEKNPRSRAASVLGRLRTVDKSALPALTTMLASTDTNHRRIAARLIAKLGAGAKPAMAALVKALDDKDYSVRSSAMTALGAIGAPAVVPLAKRMLNPKARSDRYQIARILAKLGPKAAPAIPHLIKGLGERSSFMSDACVNALAKIGKPAQAALLKELETGNRRAQSNAARALAMIKPPSVDVFKKLLKVAANRRFSSYSLGKMATALGAKAIPTLREVLKDGTRSFTERAAAVECAGRMGKAARPLLKDLYPLLAETRMSYQVKRALRPIGAGKDDIPMIREALGSADRATREGAVVSLGGAGKLAVPLLKELLNGPPETRSSAVTAAEALGAEAAPLVPELVDALKVRGTRWTAERALVKIKAPAVGPLVSALASDDAAVRESAARALGRIGPKHTAVAKAPLQALLEKEPERAVRLQVALALGSLGGDGTKCIPILLRDWEAAESDAIKAEFAKAITSFGKDASNRFAARLLKDLDYDGLAVRKRAIDSLGKVATKLSDATKVAAVPKLMTIARDDPSLNIQMSAISTLGSFGAHAEPALPILRKLQAHANHRVRSRARYAVQRIERYRRYRRSRRPRRVR